MRLPGYAIAALAGSRKRLLSCSPPALRDGRLSTPARKFGDVSGGLPEALVLSQLREQPAQVVSSEFPLKGAGDAFVALAETDQPLPHLCERAEVVRGEHLALDDGEVDLDLVKPAGVDRGVDRDDGRPA